jgi:hypothetical protein
MRYISTDERPIDMGMLREVMRGAHPDFRINSNGLLTFHSAAIADIEINMPADDIFGEEIEQLAAVAHGHGHGTGPNLTLVSGCLRAARTIVAVQVLFEDLDEQSLDALQPLWKWLFDNRKGLLQADGEGFWRESTLLLRRD